MIKRLILVGGVTGLAHLVTFWSLSYLSKTLSPKEISTIGEIDSLILLMVSIISFGLQLSASRNIATSSEWVEELKSTQQARFTLSILLLIIGIFSYLANGNYWLFCIAPFIALNADYALYGRGMPVSGATVAFIRVFIPALTLVVFAYIGSDWLIELYVISFIFSYVCSGIVVKQVLNVPYIVPLSISTLKKYLANLHLGIAALALFFIGIGVINIASHFYNDQVIAEAYLALKLYMIYKGVRRIVVQTYFKDLAKKQIALMVDYIAIFLGVGYVIFSGIYVGEMIYIVYDETYNSASEIFAILAICGFTSSVFTSAGTKLLLMKKDKEYTISYLIAGVILVLSCVLFYFLIPNVSVGIGYSILVAEVVLGVLLSFFLGFKKWILPRVRFILYAVAMLIAAFFLKFNIANMWISIPIVLGLVIGIAGGIYYRTFYKSSTLNA